MKVKVFEFNPISENTYVVSDATNECVIIDPGCYFPEEKEELLNYIIDNNLIVKYLLNTHLHLDHIFGNTFVKEQFGLLTMAHEADKFLADSMPSQMQMFGFPPTNEIPEIGTFLNEGDVIEFGNQRFDVIHVPGHSPGSIVFYNKQANCLFVGDVLFRFGIGRTDLLGGNHQQLINGIREKLFILSPDTVVYSGHGPTTTIGDEMRNNAYL